MSTISQNLTRLQNAKTSVANAITAKGGTVSSGDGFEDFANDINSIPTGSSNVPYVEFIGTQSFTLSTVRQEASWDGYLYYSTDTENWTLWNGRSISSVNNKLYLGGKGNSVISNGNRFIFTTNGTIECNGILET